MSVSAWVSSSGRAGCCAASASTSQRARAGVLGRRHRSTTVARSSPPSTARRVLLPLVDAALLRRRAARSRHAATLDSQLTRRLRDALHARASAQLQFGQVLLASIGSTAPFIGLFGTVWGIYHALRQHLGRGQRITIEQVAGPVGESLIMTAAGLAVAIPAVLAYNVFGKRVAACEAELEGFAHDLREMHRRRVDRCAEAAAMAFGRLERNPGAAADERHQHDAADRRHAGAAGDLHDHGAADDVEPEARPAEDRRARSRATTPQFVTRRARHATAASSTATRRSTPTTFARSASAAAAQRNPQTEVQLRADKACPTAASPS